MSRKRGVLVFSSRLSAFLIMFLAGPLSASNLWRPLTSSYHTRVACLFLLPFEAQTTKGILLQHLQHTFGCQRYPVAESSASFMGTKGILLQRLQHLLWVLKVPCCRPSASFMATKGILLQSSASFTYSLVALKIAFSLDSPQMCW